MKNPDWNREEIILALDLYFNLDYGQMHARNGQVIRLSEELRRMNIHLKVADHESFRSVNSVALKLNNIKKWDQNFDGKSAKNGGKLEGEIWKEFYRHRDKLKKEAIMIRLMYPDPAKGSNGSQTEQANKNLLYLVHKSRESDPVINKLKLEIYKKDNENPECEICHFQPTTFFGELGNQVLEIHYNRELHSSPGIEPIDMDDYIVICPSCHSILDKHYRLINSYDLKILINKDTN